MIHACRPDCAACCIAPSISSTIPALGGPKPAGMPCPHLDGKLLCQLFGKDERPAVCSQLKPCADMCGSSAREAMETLAAWEEATRP